MDDMTTLILTLAATIVIELGVLLFLGEKRRRVLTASVVVNVLTNVPLNLWLRAIDGGLSEILLGEVVVLIVEGLWYYWFVRRWEQAFVYSLLCNVISFLTGVLAEMVLELYLIYSQ